MLVAMKPILVSRDRLILRSRPWLLGIGLICVMLVFFGITVDQSLKSAPDAWKPLMIFGIFAEVFSLFVRQVVVVFDRPAGTVVIHTRTVFGSTAATHSLTGLTAAKIEADTSDSSDSIGGTSKPTHRPVLRYSDGKSVPITTIFSGGDGAETTAKAVNAWLRKPKT